MARNGESVLQPPPPYLDHALPPVPFEPRDDRKLPLNRHSLSRKPVTGSENIPPAPPRHDPASLPRVQVAPAENRQAFRSNGSAPNSRTPSYEIGESEVLSTGESEISIPPTQTLPLRQRDVRQVSDGIPQSEVGEISVVDDGGQQQRGHYHVESMTADFDNVVLEEEPEPTYQPLQYHHMPFDETLKKADKAARATAPSSSHSHSTSSLGEIGNRPSSNHELQVPRSDLPRPNSVATLGSDGLPRGRAHSPRLSIGGSNSPGGSPINNGRGLSSNRRTPDSRPISYIDLLNVPYPQQVAPAPSMDNALLRNAVGTNASLLDTRKTLDMYRANVKKTNDPAIQYEFAIFMVQASRDSESAEARADLLREARSILQKLADRSYPFAQYYLGDGYASGLFNKGKEDWERAFPLFIAASKHGHAEAGYRAALCYEFGWGCRKDYAKAVQFFRAAASKNHPGAATRLGRACMTGDMGLANRAREGMRWLKRAAESADFQYNAAPYELGCLHENGYGDDIFKDEAYAAQLYTQSADLGHPEASLRMGQAYEHGQLTCPKDPALSVHFYNGAAQAGIPEAMMALCAWYFVGAEPVLEKDENEAYEWSKRAAESGK